MLQHVALRDFFWYAEIVLRTALLARLIHLGLVRRYPVLATLLGFTVVRSLVLAFLMKTGGGLFGQRSYSALYVPTQPIIWVLYFLLILELYSIMLEDFPGVRRLGRLVLYTALGTVAGVCSVLILVEQQTAADGYPVLSFLALQERSIFLGLGVLTLLLLLFVAHYQLSIPRNVWVLVASFGGYFLANALLVAVRWYLGGEFTPIRNVLSPLLVLAAFLGSVAMLSKAGEAEKRPISSLWGARNRELEATLAQELRGFNRVLLKVLKQ
jgi:hypothetical protein